MASRITMIIGLALLLLTAGASSSLAQVVYGQPTAGSFRFFYNSWQTEIDGVDTTLSQMMMPVTGFVPVRDNLDITFYAATSSNTLSTPDEDYKLSGLSDIRVQGRRSFLEDQVMVALGMNLPTGKKELNFTEEYLVLQGLARNFFEFPMRRFGEGFGFTLLVAGATAAGENTRLGAGLSYQYVGEYKPYDGNLDYNPGDILSLNISGELVNGPTRWMANMIYSRYTTDETEGIETFRQTPQMDLRLSMNHGGDMISYGGMARFVLRGDNKAVLGTGSELASVKYYGNEFELMSFLSWKASEKWYVAPSAEVRFIGGNDVDFNNSTVFGFGATAGRPINEHFNFDAGLKFYTGSATMSDQFISGSPETDVNISGYQITVGLSAAM